jgi:hypothetical protein
MIAMALRRVVRMSPALSVGMVRQSIKKPDGEGTGG